MKIKKIVCPILSVNYAEYIYQMVIDTLNKKHHIDNTKYYNQCHKMDIDNHNDIFKFNNFDSHFNYEYDFNDARIEFYTSMIDDERKQRDPNIYWCNNNVRAIIYSPTITTGLDYSIKDSIDTLFGSICERSASQRDFIQMMARVRHIKSDTIYIYVGNMPILSYEDFYSYDLIKDYDNIKLVSEMILKYDELDSPIGFIKEDKPVHKILIHNEVETRNKEKHLFIPLLIELLTLKGHTIMIDDDEYNRNIKYANEDHDHSIINMANASVIDNDQFDEYCKLQQYSIAKTHHKLSIIKYLYARVFNKSPTEIDIDFIKKTKNLVIPLKNLKHLLDPTTIGTTHINFEFDDKKAISAIDYANMNIVLKINKKDSDQICIHGLIKLSVDLLGFVDKTTNKIIFGKINNSGIPKMQFNKNVVNFMKSSFFNSKTSDVCDLLKINKTKFNSVKSHYETATCETSNKKIFGLLNSIYRNWGFRIHAIHKTKNVVKQDKIIINVQNVNSDSEEDNGDENEYENENKDENKDDENGHEQKIKKIFTTIMDAEYILCYNNNINIYL